MKKIIIGTIALTAGLLLTGCGENAPKEESAKVESAPKEKRAPECGSNDVKNMIIDGFSTKSTEQTKGYLESNKKGLVKLEQQLKQKNDKYLKNNIERSRKTIAEQEAIVKNGYKFNLKRILTESVDDRAQKSVCKAELHTITGGKHYIWDLGYTAQYTSDGELVIDMKRFKNFNLDWIFSVKSVTDVKPEKKVSYNVKSDGNNIIKQEKTVNNNETKSNNTVSNTPDLEVKRESPIKHKAKQTTGLTLISKDDLWTELRLSSKSESCEISVREMMIRGNRLLTSNCIFITNSKNVAIVCTKNKSMCKTEVEVENYADSIKM